MLKTCLNTPESKISPGVPPFQAIIIIACAKDRTAEMSSRDSKNRKNRKDLK
jgi:hypothetical protein